MSIRPLNMAQFDDSLRGVILNTGFDVYSLESGAFA